VPKEPEPTRILNHKVQGAASWGPERSSNNSNRRNFATPITTATIAAMSPPIAIWLYSETLSPHTLMRAGSFEEGRRLGHVVLHVLREVAQRKLVHQCPDGNSRKARWSQDELGFSCPRAP
jgi:hypothetical protein